MPLSVTGEPVTVTLAVMVSVAGTAPTAVGENTTLIVQVAPAFRVAPQVPPPAEREYRGDEKASVIPVPVAVPVLCSVRVCAALVVPVATLPKVNGPPVTLSTAVAGPAANSTAPASTAVVCLPRIAEEVQGRRLGEVRSQRLTGCS